MVVDVDDDLRYGCRDYDDNDGLALGLRLG